MARITCGTGAASHPPDVRFYAALGDRRSRGRDAHGNREHARHRAPARRVHGPPRGNPSYGPSRGWSARSPRPPCAPWARDVSRPTCPRVLAEGRALERVVQPPVRQDDPLAGRGAPARPVRVRGPRLPVVEPPEQVVQFGQRGRRGQRPAHLGADREALDVPGHVLAEVDRRRAPRRPSTRPSSSACRRITAATCPKSGRGAVPRPPARRTRPARSPNSHGRPRQPRPTTTPSQPVSRIIRTRVLGRTRCRRCRARGSPGRAP